MPQMTVTIYGKPYTLSCPAGNEDHVHRLAEGVNVYIDNLLKHGASLSQQGVLIYALLGMMDKIESLEARVESLKMEVQEATERSLSFVEPVEKRDDKIVSAPEIPHAPKMSLGVVTRSTAVDLPSLKGDFLVPDDLEWADFEDEAENVILPAEVSVEALQKILTQEDADFSDILGDVERELGALQGQVSQASIEKNEDEVLQTAVLHTEAEAAAEAFLKAATFSQEQWESVGGDEKTISGVGVKNRKGDDSPLPEDADRLLNEVLERISHLAKRLETSDNE